MSRSPDAAPTAVSGRRYLALLLDYAFHAATVAVPLLLLGERSTVGSGGGLVDAYRLAPDYALRFDDQQIVLTRDELLLIGAISLGFLLLFFVITQGLAGWTLGKLATGIRTVDGDGSRPGIGRALVRTIVLVIDAIPSYVVPLVGGFFVLVTRTNRRLGDLVGGTYVVHRSAVGRYPDGSDVIDPEAWPEGAEPLPVTTLAEGEALRVGDAAPEREEPAAAAAPTPTADRGPQWDPARKAYIQWDPRNQVWLQHDDATGTWGPIR